MFSSEFSFEEPSFGSADFSLEQEPETSTPALTFLEIISNSKNPVYRVYDSFANIQLALKMFPYQNDSPSYLYLAEKRFQVLTHPNVVCICSTQDE